MAKTRILTWACACQASVTAAAVQWVTRCHAHLDGPDEYQEMAIDATQDRQSDPSAPASIAARKTAREKAPRGPRPAREKLPRPPRPAQPCPQCGVSFIPIGPRKCCSPACSRARWLAQVRAREETRDYAAEYARRAARDADGR